MNNCKQDLEVASLIEYMLRSISEGFEMLCI